MKRRIEIIQSLFKIKVTAAIAVLLVVLITNVAGAQERVREHAAAGRQINSSQERFHQPVAPVNRQPAVHDARQRAPDNNWHAAVPNGNQVHSTPVARQNNDWQNRINRPAANTNVHANTHTDITRSTTINNNITRTNVQVVNRVNYTRPVYSANNPSWHYANLPRRNAVIATIPAGYRTINYGGYNYRYNHGVFYRPYKNTFMVVAPPIGIYIDVLPAGCRRLMISNYPYYYYNGTYYDYRDNHYLVVSPPVGAVVESLPPGYETITIDGDTYYTVDGAQYKPVVQENGEVWYEVIKAN